jgi:stage II sporulation protein D
MVLTYKNTPFAASWTQNSAGATADFSTVFRKKALVPPGVTAPLAARDRQQHAWSFSMTKAHLAKLLETPSVNGVDLYIDKTSNKVYGLKVACGNGNKNFSFINLQKAIGPQKLRSNDFTVDVRGDSLVFKGFGEGPGVGLCIYSARTMAEKGEKAPKILEAFFPETKLVNLRSFPQAVESEETP